MKRLTLLATITATLTVTSTAAATTPIYWTPAKMAAALTALQYPQSSEQVWKTACKGATVARHGTYAGFRCTVTYYGHTTATVWAKPLVAGRVCGSTVNLRACKPLATGPLAGDPRVCSGGASDECVIGAATTAATTHWKEQTGYSQPPPTCVAVSTFVYRCVAGGGAQTWTYTVTFTKGASAWTTTVTP